MNCLLWCLQSPVALLEIMVAGAIVNNPKRNFFLSLLLLSIFLTVSEESNASIEKLTEASESTDQSNRSIDSAVTLNETINKANELLIIILRTSKTQIITARSDATQKFCIGGLCVSFLLFIFIISVPSIIILTLFIIFLSYTLRQKHNHQSNKVYASGRLMQLNEQNSFKEAESVKFTKSKTDTETSASEVKPLRNMSEESELSRSVMASTSSEREDENGLQRKKSLIEKRKH
ncbi:hypothetical protein X798_00110 [Onchocerca flexuosa]|uniref:Uncharacterized protein n=2 Tax=Onchocerca flexuosa TaxID=387005 RepID=A0A238C4X1_9BILA|nr:hypothetical protein X798_00110 [Onchocerca flexuosa]